MHDEMHDAPFPRTSLSRAISLLSLAAYYDSAVSAGRIVVLERAGAKDSRWTRQR